MLSMEQLQALEELKNIRSREELFSTLSIVCHNFYSTDQQVQKSHDDFATKFFVQERLQAVLLYQDFLFLSQQVH